MSSNIAEAADRRRSSFSTRISLLDDVRNAGDVEAWRRFVDAYTPLVYGYCRQRRLQESDARDVTQNVFFAVSRAMRSFQYDPQRGRFRSWLGTITCREIRRYLTWVNRLQDPAGEGGQRASDLDRDLESEWESQCTAFLLQQALREVQPAFAADVWRAFQLTWLEDAPPADAARQLDRPVAWVYKAKFQVLTQLRQKVQKLSDDLPLRPR